MQFALPGAGEILLIGFVALTWTVVIVGVVRLFGWLVDRRTTELRQRVALLEHEVADLQETVADGDRGSDGRERRTGR